MVLVLVKLPKGEMFISTNELHLSLVIESLFDNTNKFTDSGSVTLKIKLDKAQSKLRIEVTDTGDGIEEDKIKLIFDKYYRSENHKREVVGTGLGLSIVKAILKLHNYHYGVNSKLGEGSTFWFVIRDVKTDSTESSSSSSKK